RELHNRTPAKLFLCDWFRMMADVYPTLFKEAGDHAGEMETALILAYHPHLVVQNPDGTLAADEGRAAPTRFEAVNRGWVSITRPWHLLTTDTGVGNPHAATAEQGRELMRQIVDRLAS